MAEAIAKLSALFDQQNNKAGFCVAWLLEISTFEEGKTAWLQIRDKHKTELFRLFPDFQESDSEIRLALFLYYRAPFTLRRFHRLK